MTDIASTDPYVVIQEFTGTHTFTSSYNVTYLEAVTQLGTLPVVGITLIVDSGWGANGDQVVRLTSATVGVGPTNAYRDVRAAAGERDCADLRSADERHDQDHEDGRLAVRRCERANLDPAERQQRHLPGRGLQSSCTTSRPAH